MERQCSPSARGSIASQVVNICTEARFFLLKFWKVSFRTGSRIKSPSRKAKLRIWLAGGLYAPLKIHLKMRARRQPNLAKGCESSMSSATDRNFFG